MNKAVSNPPKLGDGIYFRNVDEKIVLDKFKFEMYLVDWVSRYVSRSRVAQLMFDAQEDFRQIHQHVLTAPTSMNLSNTRRIEIGFDMEKTGNNGWYVKAIYFSMSVRNSAIVASKRAQEKARLYREAQDRVDARGPSMQSVFFDTKLSSGDIAKDLARGKDLTASAIKFAHQRASAVVSLPKNPIGPDMSDPTSILLELGKVIPGATVGLMQANKARKGFEVANQIVDGAEKINGVRKTGQEDGAQAAVVKGLSDGLEFGLGAATGGNPLTGFIGTIIGSFVNIGIANMAGEVAKKRLLIYHFFTGGLIMEASHQKTVNPQSSSQQAWYSVGAGVGRPWSEYDAFCFQLALLEYTDTHNMTNWGLHTPSKRWHALDDYARAWNPATLYKSMIFQFYKKQYLTE